MHASEPGPPGIEPSGTFPISGSEADVTGPPGMTQETLPVTQPSHRPARHATTAAKLVLPLAALLSTGGAFAEPVVGGAWARATPPGAQTGAVYLTLVGDDAPDRLLGGHTSAARELQIHTHVHADGMMRMEQLPELEIPARETVEFRPHGLHLMLIGLSKPLVAGDELSITLDFERAGEMELSVPVRDAR